MQKLPLWPIGKEKPVPGAATADDDDDADDDGDEYKSSDTDRRYDYQRIFYTTQQTAYQFTTSTGLWPGFLPQRRRYCDHVCLLVRSFLGFFQCFAHPPPPCKSHSDHNTDNSNTIIVVTVVWLFSMGSAKRRGPNDFLARGGEICTL